MSILAKLLRIISGGSEAKLSTQLLYDKVVGFRGITGGVGTSTIVQNVAIALSERTNYSICVLDTSYNFPTQYPLLNAGNDDDRVTDYLEFSSELSGIVVPTNYASIHLASLSKRTVIEMLSSLDNQITIEKLISSLKTYYDVVLIDLSHEFTNINTYAAVKCNRIINITDQSLKSSYYLRKSLNTLMTLAVPLAKANTIILNKKLPDVLTSTSKSLEESGQTVLAEIPLSIEIAKQGLTGKRIYAAKTSDKDIYLFSKAVDAIIDSILQVTPLNENQSGVHGVREKEQPTVRAEVQSGGSPSNDDTIGGVLED